MEYIKLYGLSTPREMISSRYDRAASICRDMWSYDNLFYEEDKLNCHL